MITFYLYNNLGYFTESREYDEYGAVPGNGTVTAPPPYGPEKHVAQWNNGAWHMVLPLAESITAYDPAVDRAHVVTLIKAYRDELELGGVKLGDVWFHSDYKSLTKYLGLKDAARDILDAGGSTADPIMESGQIIVWTPLHGPGVEMTVAMAFELVAAVRTLQSIAFVVAKHHITAVQQSELPLEYNYTSGWPKVFNDVNDQLT